MTGWSRFMSSSFGNIQKLREVRCTSDYFSSKNDIVQQISKIIILPHPHFCRRCQVIKKDIISKNNELSHCYKYNSLRHELIDHEDIKEFIKKCPEVSECIRNDPSRAKKTTLPKDPKLQPCKNNNTCTTGTVSTEVAGKPKAQLETTSSGIIIQERPKQSEKNQKPDSAGELKYAEISAGTEPDKISLADTAGAPRKPPVPEDIEHFNKNGQGETSAQSSQALPHSTNVELDTLSNAPLKNTPILESQSSDHSPLFDLAEDTPKSASYEEQDIAGIPTGEQDDSQKITESQDQKDIVAVKENIAIADIDNITDDGRDVNVAVSVDESDGNKSLGSEVSDAPKIVNALSCNGTSCIEEKDSQLVTNNDNILATLSYITDIIQNNKDHMIKASIPMGIVLLLTLLFKVN
ncbi:hypothetical protein PVC01_000098300 [Plasmodium vivax]|uniref:VIR protein n=1 Tax=Plasmodium vivax TaxID=5855 RepID=A0A1G4EAP3_PLAVI|nr:hypothetical protein PVC01_000098300 [Plasmodium vivax]